MQRTIKDLLKDQSGSIAFMAAFMLNVWLLCVALAFDLGSGYLTRTTMSGAADAAAFAASKVDEGDLRGAALRNEMRRVGRMYFEANLPEENTPFGIEYDYDDDVRLRLDASSVQVVARNFESPIYFGYATSNKDKADLNISTNSRVSRPEAQLQPIDYHLVIDLSDSMVSNTDSSVPINGGPATRTVNRLTATKYATIQMINSIFDKKLPLLDKNGQPFFRLGLYGYADNYLPGAESGMLSDAEVLRSKVRALSARGNKWTCGSCAMREVETAVDKARSERPEAQQVVIFMTDGLFNTAYSGGNGANKASRVFPHTNENEMNACPPSYVPRGLYDRYYSSSPPSAGPYLAQQGYPGDYKTRITEAEYNKLIDIVNVELTKKDNPEWCDCYSPEKNFWRDLEDRCAVGHAEFANHCKATRDKGATIWTIAFGNAYYNAFSQEQIAINNSAMAYCASTNTMYEQAMSGIDLEKIFEDIIATSSRIRLVE